MYREREKKVTTKVMVEEWEDGGYQMQRNRSGG
jgi:hypothetical protein